MSTYNYSALAGRIADQLSRNGLQEAGLNPQQIHGMDQFHVGGAEPVERLISAAALPEGGRLLDVGCGLGGVSRLMATQGSQQVAAIDLDEGMVNAARDLTIRCGLEDRIRFMVGDARSLQLDEAPFDAAVLVHVQMNIEDKQSLFDDIRALLKPGGKLLLWEICADDPQLLSYPMPWSMDGCDSFLTGQLEMKAMLENAGLAPAHWVLRDEFAQAWTRQLLEEGPPAGPVLPALLDRGMERISTLGKAILAGKVNLVEAVCHAE